MSTTIKTIMAFGLFAIVAACAQQEEVVMVDPAPVTVDEPMSKY